METIKSETEKRTFSPEEEQMQFLVGLKEVCEELNKSKLDWRLVGGLAINVIAGQPIEARRRDGSIRDIDLLTLNVNPDEVARLDQFFKNRSEEEKARGLIFPEVSIVGGAKTENYLKERESFLKLPQIFTHILRRGDDFFLQFRDLEEKLDPRVLEKNKIQMEIDGKTVDISTLPWETIVHFYLIRRTSHIKEKDFEKIRAFLKKEDGRSGKTEGKIDHTPYRVFHRFAAEIKKKYHLITLAWQLYDLIDNRVFHSAFSHKAIPKDILDILIEA